MVVQPSLLAGEAPPVPAIPAPTVAYQSDRVTLYAGDCAGLVGLLPTVDLLCTDPPYGVRWNSGWSGGRFGPLLGDDGTLDVPGLLGAITRAHLREKRHVYVFGYRSDQLADPMQLGGTTQLIWDKGEMGMGDLSCPWGPQHEPITFGARYPSKADRVSGRGSLTARLRAGSVLRHTRPIGKNVNRHPTEKPVRLMAELIESSTRRGEVVLDPFAGSGSTLVAALLTGRHAIGCELDERYVAVAIDRIREAEQIADRIAAA
ncbi:DNA-methyltransferase [Actinacidiphila glaucinigra]|uniref:DNA-methyltransferase n=1 Tax=Actinacidiphila glaucinigra TaxID=235986 RepID=UPI003865A878